MSLILSHLSPEEGKAGLLVSKSWRETENRRQSELMQCIQQQVDNKASKPCQESCAQWMHLLLRTVEALASDAEVSIHVTKDSGSGEKIEPVFYALDWGKRFTRFRLERGMIMGGATRETLLEVARECCDHLVAGYQIRIEVAQRGLPSASELERVTKLPWENTGTSWQLVLPPFARTKGRGKRKSAK
jgi:hypothetical protein